MRKIIFLIVFITIGVWVVFAQPMGLRIIAPLNEARVSERPIIEGTVTDPSASVWIVVHPMETADFWVQPRVTIREGGKWKVQIYIGRPGTMDIGKHFEIMAVANPNRNLKEGDVLDGWPSSQARSLVIEVTRR